MRPLNRIILVKITHISQNPPWRDKATGKGGADLKTPPPTTKRSKEAKELEEAQASSSRQFLRDTIKVHVRASEQHGKLSIANQNESLRQSPTMAIQL